MLRLIGLALLCVALTSCGNIGMTAGPNKNASEQDNLILPRTSPNSVDAALSVGSALGYDAIQVDRNLKNLVFQKQASLGIGVLVRSE
jgi:hypothetical protein